MSEDMKQNYVRMLEEGYFETGSVGRLVYISDHIFDFTTYDESMSELFAIKALEVCAAVSDGKTFSYIEDPVDYQWFLVMVNMPFFVDKLEWGTSIRGAWWGEPSPHEKIKFSSCGLWLDDKQLTETMEFTREQWAEFIAALLEFSKAETAPA